MKKYRHLLQVVMIALLASATTWLITYTATIKGTEKDLKDMMGDAERYKKLTEIQNYVDNYFVGEYDEKKVMEGAAAGYVNGLGDKWTYYMTPEQYEEHKRADAPVVTGIGINVSWDEERGLFIVRSVNEGSSAEEAGLQVDDLITSVDGKATDELGHQGSIEAMRGDNGTRVEIGVLRGEESKTFVLERRSVTKDFVVSRLLDGKVGYVHILRFDAGAQDQFLAAVDRLISGGAEAFVFDVRNNPGGDLQVLISILNRILADKDLFIEEYQNGERYTFSSDSTSLNYPISVLANRNSYSAAEFFTAVLQEYGVATVVGEKTTGKGYGQTTFALEDGSALTLSIIRYYTPDGKSLKDMGVTPDEEVALDEELMGKVGAMTMEEDPQLAAAVAACNPAS